jgi:hypothetical protein
MALSTHANLLAAVAAWLGRSDLAATIPDFITLAENEFNRTLRTIEMEATTSLTIASGSVAVPADFLGVRSLYVANTILDYITPGEALEDDSTGSPIFYTIVDGTFKFRPAESGTATLYYYQAIPALTSGNTTNWLMTKHPDLYLFATLAQAEFYGWNDARLPLVKARTEEILEQINGGTAKERYGGRRLVAQSRVPQVRNIRA